jgi:hypothetical protein
LSIRSDGVKIEEKSTFSCCFGGAGGGVTDKFLKVGLRYSALKEFTLNGKSFEVRYVERMQFERNDVDSQ